MYSYEIIPHLQVILKRLYKKDRVMYERVLKKIDEIIQGGAIDQYKNLRYDLKDKKRVHIRHFVLIFQLVKAENRIIFQDFDHHDRVYIR